MGENITEYLTAYSYEKIEDTAKTFRRLSQAYGEARKGNEDNDDYNGHAGIERQLILLANVLEECVAVGFHSQEISKSKYKELFKKSFLQGIRIKNAVVLKNANGMIELGFLARSVGKSCVSAKKMIPVLSDVMGFDYYIPNSARTIINDQYEQFIFIRENRFKVLSGVSRKGKGTSKFNGDNFLMSRLEGGKTIAAIADGMGSGKRAFAESRMVIELMENCIDAGFEEKAALDLINSAYIAGGASKCNPVTMDMGIIDCHTGMLTCIKLGAVATFIKRESMVEIIKSTTLPIGVLENVDYDCVTKKLYDGDYVIMISDGLLDILPGVDKEKKMAKIINSIDIKKPDAMAEEIMRKSLKYNGGKPFDDMTVLVLGLFDTYDK